MSGNLIIISAPSGAGKTTLVREVLKLDPHVRPSISYTSRARRESEIDGVDYHFVSRDDFESLVESGELIEWAYVHGNLYGTSKQQVEQALEAGNDFMLAIDIQGAKSIREAFPEAVSIFILPPSYDVLIERLGIRGANDQGDMKLRLNNAITEMKDYVSFEYVVVNDDLARATNELTAIIIAERCRRSRRTDMAENIISNFTNNGGSIT